MLFHQLPQPVLAPDNQLELRPQILQAQPHLAREKDIRFIARGTERYIREDVPRDGKDPFPEIRAIDHDAKQCEVPPSCTAKGGAGEPKPMRASEDPDGRSTSGRDKGRDSLGAAGWGNEDRGEAGWGVRSDAVADGSADLRGGPVPLRMVASPSPGAGSPAPVAVPPRDRVPTACINASKIADPANRNLRASSAFEIASDSAVRAGTSAIAQPAGSRSRTPTRHPRTYLPRPFSAPPSRSRSRSRASPYCG